MLRNPFYRKLFLWFIIALVAISLFRQCNQPVAVQKGIEWSEFISALEQGQVERVVTQEGNYYVIFRDGTQFTTFGPQATFEFAEKCKKEYRVDIFEAKPPEKPSVLVTILSSIIPFFLFIVVFIFLMRMMNPNAGGKGGMMGVGKSKAKLFDGSQKKVTFDDVAGCDEAKKELEEVIEFLKNPKKFSRLGGKIPKGTLLVGPPGTGKTLLAKAVAGEAGCPFFNVAGSDFVEMFVGVGASRIRDLFEQGKKHAPCIIFIDELDALGKARGAGIGGGNDEREQTLNQFLVEMDGFEDNSGVVIIGATNRPDTLDPGLLRAGRFDRQVTVNRPDVNGRVAIFRIHTREIKLAEDVDLWLLACSTPGFTGADIANICNEAALMAARQNAEAVAMTHFYACYDRIVAGTEQKKVMTENEKRRTAGHEIGHALVAKFIPGSDPVQKVSIVSRGMALGYTLTSPIHDIWSYTEDYLKGTMAKLMGGRAADQLVHEQKCSGASNDIDKATEIARKMITRFGMSEEIGPIAIGNQTDHVFLGHMIAQDNNASEAMRNKIDKEVRKLVQEALDRAKDILTAHRDLLDRLTDELFIRETLIGNEIDIIIDEMYPGAEFVRTPTAKDIADAERKRICKLEEQTQEKEGTPDDSGNDPEE